VFQPGDAAPDFVLKDAEGVDVRLSSLRGPIVLYFYPKDNTAGCTIQAKNFRDHYDELVAKGATVVGVSLDSSESHCRVRDRLNLPFHLLSDPDGRVHDVYDAWKTTLFGRSAIGVRRCTFLIDEDGIIRAVFKSVRPWGHAQEVLRQLERLNVHSDWPKK